MRYKIGMIVFLYDSYERSFLVRVAVLRVKQTI